MIDCGLILVPKFISPSKLTPTTLNRLYEPYTRSQGHHMGTDNLTNRKRISSTKKEEQS